MRRSVCISVLIIVIGTCLLVFPAPTRSVAAPSAKALSWRARPAGDLGVPARRRPPVPGRVVKGFDPPAKPWLPGSRGVEFAASPGEPVRTVTAGVVVFAGQVAGTGAVSIMLPDGRRTTHMPVVPVVAVGDVVVPGQVIGLVGVGPPCSRTCLHWGLKKGTEYQNPMTLLDTGVRLLPMQGRARVVSVRRGLRHPLELPGAKPRMRSAGTLMPPWLGAGRDGVILVDEQVARAVARKGSRPGVSLTKSRP
ncbi:M23 family metallopeptidase [Cutibacterium avidum]|uniref:M23 family metallopeptidase n=1 Tax=Cutibacterium avidum TaxID=33010 RepID=UPI00192C57F0|nr:M23 family metallopeptidase [Cutibacterium avidum]MCO6678319.1 peptidoglycan DD-metalloendopeptidase family protein [Cutibacterium avidum]MDU5415956.1 M23 family metallopeptidase [Cutibacterium avidum]MDU5418703.1 M23 family metallopeptidase [Cutibacterium avidum]MDU6251480.1 M23 family metallopeptidase [Cutibacterium avidum]QQY12121.1 M23 family metallopeptidase [Cutibacterium avidum]